MNLVELDTVRSDLMKKHGFPGDEIWKYDVVTRDQALAEAYSRQDFDGMQNLSSSDKLYALLGPACIPEPFSTPEELEHLINWIARNYYGVSF